MSGNVVIDDLDHDRDFTPNPAYGTAELEDILFTVELGRRFESQGVAAAAFHPEAVATNFAAESTSVVKHLYKSRIGHLLMTSPDKGARQLVRLAEGTPASDWFSGTYYEKFKLAKKTNPQAHDVTLARALWDQTESLLA